MPVGSSWSVPGPVSVPPTPASPRGCLERAWKSPGESGVVPFFFASIDTPPWQLGEAGGDQLQVRRPPCAHSNSQNQTGWGRQDGEKTSSFSPSCASGIF